MNARRLALVLIAALFLLTVLIGWRVALLPLLFLNAFVLLHLGLASLRRVLFTLAARQTPCETPAPPADFVLPRLTALVPCRDEAAALPATLAAWAAVDYPRDRLELVFIDDSSADETPGLLEAFARDKPWVKVVRRAAPAAGKGAALNDGLANAAPAELVAVFDADARPAPDCPRLLAERLADPTVAGVAGRMSPLEHDHPAAVYAAVEAAVHQRLTLTGAARLGATVAFLGSAYAVRRSLLDPDGFAPGERLEDIELSLRLLAEGYQLAWEPRAVCRHLAPADTAAFRRQRESWARGYHRLARRYYAPLVLAAPSPLLAFDRLLFCASYLDRFSLLAAIALAALARWVLPILWMPWWFVASAAALPLLQIPLAVRADGWPATRRRRVAPALALVFWDFAAEWRALAADLAGKPLPWRRADRAPEPRGES